MRWSAVLTTAAVALVLTSAAPARAELVFFPSGRALSVRAVRSNGDLIVLKLRSGGEITCDRDLIVKVEPDEIEYPEEVLAAMPSARTILEPPDIPEPYREVIATAAKKHGVDARLVHAVIQVESAYQSHAVSRAGARGLMQILPSTGRQYGALDLFDPKVNVEAGVRHLKTLLKRFDLPLALAAYNAGEGAVARFGGIPPFKETQNYVTRILRLLGPS
jgi:hypothetical protein